jgi:DeoR family transcriptional regulator, aga operon transcriptional repressor
MSLLLSDATVLSWFLSFQSPLASITIRKDLDYLDSKGLVQRTHGGALAPQSTTMLDPSLKEKEQHQFNEKQLIAAAAVKLGPLAVDVLREIHADIFFWVSTASTPIWG